MPLPVVEVPRPGDRGSFDSGDPFTTNLFIGNLAPDCDEQVGGWALLGRIVGAHECGHDECGHECGWRRPGGRLRACMRLHGCRDQHR